MLKKSLYTLLFATISLVWLNANAQCKAKDITKGCKKNLESYKYSGAAVTDIIVDNKAKKYDVEFTAYQGQKYRLIFCSSGNVEGLQLNIFDKPKTLKSRKKVYENSQGIEGDFWVFEPKKPGNYYVEYEVPAANTETSKQACVVLIVGYQNEK
ncbi:MAG: hypothetical protein ACK4ON_07380 [Bacteroidia bacterium]